MPKDRLTDAELEQLKRLLSGIRTEDGKDYVNDMVFFADEHGEALIRELEVARGKPPTFSYEEG